MGTESDFLQWIAGQSAGSPLVKVGVGDDLAVLKWAGDDLLLVGVDQVMDGVHFDSKKHSPRQIGRKVVNRNFSDCAAMGCLPAAIVATVALPRDYSWEMAKEFYFGLARCGGCFFLPGGGRRYRGLGWETCRDGDGAGEKRGGEAGDARGSEGGG